MASEEGATSTTTPLASTGLVSTQLAQLVPTLTDPNPQAIEAWSQKVELLAEIWPQDKYHELAARLMLGTSGAAFQKLQLRKNEFMKNTKKSIQLIIEELGGTYGQVPLERRYEMAERALYRSQQRSDESGDSYLARQDVMWTEIRQKGLTLEALQAYVVLRHSRLPAEDKKRIIVESGAEGDGQINMRKVTSAIRMLQAGFFQEFTGAGSAKTGKNKNYDVALTAEENINLAEESLDEWIGAEDDGLETFLQEGDEDAALISQFEDAAGEILQNDTELSTYYSAYMDARRRLSEKSRARGFWPTSSKGRGKNGKSWNFNAKGKGKHRPPLQQRILSSKCRICNQVGHWKDECPNRKDKIDGQNPGTSAQMPISFMEAAEDAASSLAAIPETDHHEVPEDRNRVCRKRLLQTRRHVIDLELQRGMLEIGLQMNMPTCHPLGSYHPLRELRKFVRADPPKPKSSCLPQTAPKEWLILELLKQSWVAIK